MSLRRATSRAVSPETMPTGSNTLTKDAEHVHVAWLKVPRLLCFHEIPRWQQDNEYILSSYRPTSGSAWVSYASLLYQHNQTVNIYSHVLGSALFCSLPVFFYRFYFQFQPSAHVSDLVVVTIYCFGVAVCFALSSTFHIMWNHSQPVTSFCNKLDYLGILILMWGAGVPTIYYGFFCDQKLQIIYWLTTSSTALCCGIVTLHPRFILPHFRMWRACFYAGFGLSSVIFISHGLIVYGWEVQKARMSLQWMGWMATSNLAGAAIYAARIPERWVPYKFDIYGASHQIPHTAVMVAAVVHFCGLLKAFSVIRSDVDICNS